MGAGNSPRKSISESVGSAASLQQRMGLLDSIPNFAMSDFAQGSPFTRSIGKELLILLNAFGLDINYHNKQGTTPLQEAVRNKLKSL